MKNNHPRSQKLGRLKDLLKAGSGRLTNGRVQGSRVKIHERGMDTGHQAGVMNGLGIGGQLFPDHLVQRLGRQKYLRIEVLRQDIVQVIGQLRIRDMDMDFFRHWLLARDVSGQ